MADTTDRPDDEPEGSSKTDESSSSDNISIKSKGKDSTSIVVTHGAIAHLHFGRHVETTEKEYPSRLHDETAETDTPKSLDSQKEEVYLGVLQQKHRHVEVNFWISIIFIVVGFGVILAGPVVALVSEDVSALMVSLLGAPFAAIGVWLRWHVRQTSSALDARVDRIEQQIDKDHGLQRATRLTDRIKNPELRDRLHATAAMEALGVTPDPETTAGRIFAEAEVIEPEEIEPGASKP
ncbi:TRADD-N-associated membrane domain-containing protein [Nocardiopsis sp. LDBS1602]|uniref:TRADD-N-associated membrane domain-containing protein n=1 Tax=Nocardiopsis sp. LDBS1602 TaxID=3109597 RepID=UPI002DB9201D|nr:hypothetical protein [Nocardiopsis sp. LDBS1602]MEC3895429.1 hypothetical protein [Nocardiopsis sp. LDBS1602]